MHGRDYPKSFACAENCYPDQGAPTTPCRPGIVRVSRRREGGKRLRYPFGRFCYIRSQRSYGVACENWAFHPSTVARNAYATLARLASSTKAYRLLTISW